MLLLVLLASCIALQTILTSDSGHSVPATKAYSVAEMKRLGFTADAKRKALTKMNVGSSKQIQRAQSGEPFAQRQVYPNRKPEFQTNALQETNIAFVDRVKEQRKIWNRANYERKKKNEMSQSSSSNPSSSRGTGTRKWSTSLSLRAIESKKRLLQAAHEGHPDEPMFIKNRQGEVVPEGRTKGEYRKFLQERQRGYTSAYRAKLKAKAFKEEPGKRPIKKMHSFDLNKPATSD